MNKKMTWTEVIRRRVQRSGLSIYRVAKESLTPVSMVQRFMAGGGLNVDTAERICGVVGLELRPVKEGG